MSFGSDGGDGVDVVFEYDDELHSAKHFLVGGFEERLKVRDCSLEAWTALPGTGNSRRKLKSLATQRAILLRRCR